MRSVVWRGADSFVVILFKKATLSYLFLDFSAFSIILFKNIFFTFRILSEHFPQILSDNAINTAWRAFPEYLSIFDYSIFLQIYSCSISISGSLVDWTILFIITDVRGILRSIIAVKQAIFTSDSGSHSRCLCSNMKQWI